MRTVRVLEAAAVEAAEAAVWYEERRKVRDPRTPSGKGHLIRPRLSGGVTAGEPRPHHPAALRS
jgi:hypothetical protein